jgi:hypothetical protein
MADNCPMIPERFPTRRQSLIGKDLDGNIAELSFAISKKLYRCPRCGKSIKIGSEHVVVRRSEPEGAEYHQHWHTPCSAQLLRELRNIESRPRRA